MGMCVGSQNLRTRGHASQRRVAGAGAGVVWGAPLRLDLRDARNNALSKNHEVDLCAGVGLALAAALLLGRQPALIAPAIIAAADVPRAVASRPPQRALLGVAVRARAALTIRMRLEQRGHLACDGCVCGKIEAGAGAQLEAGICNAIDRAKPRGLIGFRAETVDPRLVKV